MQISLNIIPIQETADTLAAKFAAYCKERADHSLTVGVPAPFPEYDCFRTFWENGAKSIEIDPRDAALHDIRRANAIAMEAGRVMAENVAIYRAAVDPSSTDAIKAAASAMPQEVVDVVVSEDHDSAIAEDITRASAALQAEIAADAAATASAKEEATANQGTVTATKVS